MKDFSPETSEYSSVKPSVFPTDPSIQKKNSVFCCSDNETQVRYMSAEGTYMSRRRASGLRGLTIKTRGGYLYFFEKKLRIFAKLGETGLCASKKIRKFSKLIINNTGYFFIRRILKSVTYKISIKIKERIVLPAGTCMFRFTAFLVKQCRSRHYLFDEEEELSSLRKSIELNSSKAIWRRVRSGMSFC